jgi:RNA recognition motif-containing protein
MNIFVGHLAESVSAEELRRMFAAFGTVLNVRITTDATHGCHSNVYLVPDEAARRAILELDLVRLHGRQLSVRECAFRAARERRVSRAGLNVIERRHRVERRYHLPTDLPMNLSVA